MRNHDTCLFGPCTAELPKTKIPEETFDILRRKAASVGMTLTEYVRWMAMVNAHGLDTVQSMQAERLQVVAGMRETGGNNR